MWAEASLAIPHLQRVQAQPGVQAEKELLGEREERGWPPRDRLGLSFNLDLRDTSHSKCHGVGGDAQVTSHRGRDGGGAPPELP